MKVEEFVNLSTRSLSQLSGKCETSLSRFFTGKRSPNYRTIEFMATKLNMQPEQVVEGIRRKRELKQNLSDVSKKTKIA